MFEKYQNSFDYKHLLKKAKERISLQEEPLPVNMGNQQEFFQTFQINQIELEIQNEELRKAQQELESVLSKYVGTYYDQSPFGYVTLSSKGIIKKLNLTAVRSLGTERVNSLHMAFSHFIEISCQMSYFLALRQAASTLKQQSVELLLTTRRQNQEQWILATIIPDLDKSDTLYQFRLSFVDITKYQQQKARLLSIKKMYQDLFKTLPVACFLMNSHGEIIESNSHWEALTGYDIQKTRQTYFLKYVHPDWRRLFKQSFLEVISKKTDQYLQLAMIGNDGCILDVSTFLHPFPDMKEKNTTVCCCFLKKSLVKHGQSQRKHGSNPSFSELDTLPGMFIQINTEGKIIFANKAAHDALGYTSGGLNGLYQWALASDPEEAKHIKAWFKYKTENHPVPEPFAVKFKHRNQKINTYWVEWNYTRDTSGKLDGFLAQLTNISKMNQARHLFVHAIVKKNENLIKLRQDLENANKLAELLMTKKNKAENKQKSNLQYAIENRILPYVEQLKNTNLTKNQADLMEIVESNIKKVFDPFMKNIMEMDKTLTPMEFKIAELVQKGKTNKEIAQILSISNRTVGFHRESLRKKFNLVNKKVNLRSYLLSLNK